MKDNRTLAEVLADKRREATLVTISFVVLWIVIAAICVLGYSI